MRKQLLFLVAIFATIGFSNNVKAYEGFEITDMIVKTNPGDTTYQIQTTGDMTDLKFIIGSSSGEDIDTTVATISNTGLLTIENDGVVTVRVECVKAGDNLCNSHIYQVRRELSVLVDKTGTYTSDFNDIVNEYNNKKNELTFEMDKIDTKNIKVDFVKELMTLSIKLTDDDGKESHIFENFAQDFIFAPDRYLPDYQSQAKDINLMSYINDNKLEVRGYISSFSHNLAIGSHLEVSIIGPISDSKVINIIYKESNDKDKELVSKIAKTISIVNKSYINVDVFKKFSFSDLLERQFTNSEALKILKENGLDSYFDPRYGDMSPMSSFVGGHILIGKDGVFYTAQELKIYSTLKLPRMKDISLTESIKKYFESYLEGSFEIRVEADKLEEGVFRLYFKEQKALSYLDKIMNFFVPRVYADDEKVITFLVEEVDEAPVVTLTEEKNPQTGDQILFSLLLATISVIGITISRKRLLRQ